MRNLLFIVCCFSCLSLNAQSNVLDSFLTKSAAMNLHWPALQEITKKVKFYQPDKVLDQSFDLGIYHAKERYRVLIFFKEEGEPPIPHIKATLKANHFSNNQEESFVAIHTFMPEGLKKHQVDWGGVYYFKPKLELSTYRECQLVSLFKLGEGAVYVLYLFDEFSPEVEQMIWNPVFNQKSIN